MTEELDVELSPELEKFRDKIKSSMKPFISITSRKEENLALWQSKFGGFPYLPKNTEYPKDDQGNPLFLLAQINFSEVPCLEGFPQQGILQFFIADDELYGIDFDEPLQQEDFRVIYFSDAQASEEELVTDFSFLPKPEYMPLSSGTTCSLQFEKKIAPVGADDYHFDELFGNDFFGQFGKNELAIWKEYTEKFPSSGHKIGGYAYFTQNDPRPPSKNPEEEYVLLLQIDTDNPVDIMWGDSGVGNFFIKKADLEKLDFFKVFYNWDCH
ncbi:YwqG family protein [Candidatus Parabeggiatoa sp. HSG14]|uniref:YwqG family protein n=1 Tax=Candidatus Parabeggiatoa sp. HSG14 TaxID=3055593 RepID=UPI0025A699D2|nr:YwqG family protein [Thiotrichales bacterium HSG14]